MSCATLVASEFATLRLANRLLHSRVLQMPDFVRLSSGQLFQPRLLDLQSQVHPDFQLPWLAMTQLWERAAQISKLARLRPRALKLDCETARKAGKPRAGVVHFDSHFCPDRFDGLCETRHNQPADKACDKQLRQSL